MERQIPRRCAPLHQGGRRRQSSLCHPHCWLCRPVPCQQSVRHGCATCMANKKAHTCQQADLRSRLACNLRTRCLMSWLLLCKAAAPVQSMSVLQTRSGVCTDAPAPSVPTYRKTHHGFSFHIECAQQLHLARRFICLCLSGSPRQLQHGSTWVQLGSDLRPAGWPAESPITAPTL